METIKKSNQTNISLQFVTAYAQQQYLLAEQGLEQAKNDKAQYWYIDGSFPEEYPENWTTQRIEFLIDKINEYSVNPLFHGNFKAPLSSDIHRIRAAAVENVLSEIDLAAELSAPLILHGGAIVEPRLVIKSKKIALEDYIRSLDVIINYAERKGVLILLENLSNYKNYRPFHYIFTTPDEYKYVIDRIGNDNLRLFFDVGHAAICDGDPVSVIHEFNRYIWGMSFSNNDGIRDLHLGINKGLVDYNKIVMKIIEIQWSGVIAFEVRDRPFNRCVADLEEIFNNAILDNIKDLEQV